MSRTLRRLLLLGFVATTLAACGGRHYSYSRVPGPPPPPRVYGAAIARPGPEFVWIDGYYDWGGSRYRWIPGRWVRPPRPRAVWVSGHWAKHHRGHVWVSAHWR